MFNFDKLIVNLSILDIYDKNNGKTVVGKKAGLGFSVGQYTGDADKRIAIEVEHWEISKISIETQRGKKVVALEETSVSDLLDKAIENRTKKPANKKALQEVYLWAGFVFQVVVSAFATDLDPEIMYAALDDLKARCEKCPGFSMAKLASPEAKLPFSNAVFKAVLKGNTKLVSYLIDKYGVDVNLTLEDGKSLFDYAIEQKAPIEMLEMLISKGAQITEDSLYLAVKSKRLESVKLLVENGASAQTFSHKYGHSILDEAIDAQRGKVYDIVEYLVANGAKPKPEDAIKAANGSEAKLVKILTKAEVDLNVVVNGKTALDICLEECKKQKKKIKYVNDFVVDTMDALIAGGAKTAEELKHEGKFIRGRIARLKKNIVVSMSHKYIKNNKYEFTPKIKE